MPEDVPVRINSDLYEKAKAIAEAKGIKIGDAIAEASQELAPSVSICEEEGFKEELRKTGITPPPDAKWLFGFLDNFTPAMLKGSSLSPYAEARAKSKGICSLLPGAEEAIELAKLATEPAAEQSEPVSESDLPETSLETEGEGEAMVEASPSAEVIEPTGNTESEVS